MKILGGLWKHRTEEGERNYILGVLVEVLKSGENCNREGGLAGKKKEG